MQPAKPVDAARRSCLERQGPRLPVRFESPAMTAPPALFEAVEQYSLNWTGRERRRRVHAKAFGTTLTACGRNALTLEKIWYCAFDPYGSQACPECAEVVREGQRPG
jgi:hypothetical protein